MKKILILLVSLMSLISCSQTNNNDDTTSEFIMKDTLCTEKAQNVYNIVYEKTKDSDEANKAFISKYRKCMKE